MNKKQIQFLQKINGKQLFSLKDTLGIKRWTKVCAKWLKLRDISYLVDDVFNVSVPK